MSQPTPAAEATPHPHPREADAQPRAIDPEWRKYVDNPWLTLGSCFFVFGFLGVPLILMCRKFSLPAKIFWSTIVILYTLALIAGVTALLYSVYLQILAL